MLNLTKVAALVTALSITPMAHAQQTVSPPSPSKAASPAEKASAPPAGSQPSAIPKATGNNGGAMVKKSSKVKKSGVMSGAVEK